MMLVTAVTPGRFTICPMYNKKENDGVPNEEKVINKRIFGYIIGFFTILLLSLLFFWLEEKGIGIALIVFALLQIFFVLITPRAYVFSYDRLVIKYFFGLEEKIPWQDIRAVYPHSEDPGWLFPLLASYRIIYYSEEKQKFFMHGAVVKSKKTKALLKKYCTKKYDWEN